MPDDGRRLLALKIAVGIALVAGAGLLDAGSSAVAQRRPPPWCAYEGGHDGGLDCAYYTFEQCMATVNGIGGFCDRNTQYVPPPGPHGAAAPKKKKRSQS